MYLVFFVCVFLGLAKPYMFPFVSLCHCFLSNNPNILNQTPCPHASLIVPLQSVKHGQHFTVLKVLFFNHFTVIVLCIYDTNIPGLPRIKIVL